MTTPSIVLTYPQVCKRASITRRTLEHLISEGEGPAIIHLSSRRRGILESDFEAWLQTSRKPAPGKATAASIEGGR
jgi:predicted DNA-binding transcriptional regulator AlpA